MSKQSMACPKCKSPDTSEYMPERWKCLSCGLKFIYEKEPTVIVRQETVHHKETVVRERGGDTRRVEEELRAISGARGKGLRCRRCDSTYLNLQKATTFWRRYQCHNCGRVESRFRWFSAVVATGFLGSITICCLGPLIASKHSDTTSVAETERQQAAKPRASRTTTRPAAALDSPEKTGPVEIPATALARDHGPRPSANETGQTESRPLDPAPSVPSAKAKGLPPQYVLKSVSRLLKDGEMKPMACFSDTETNKRLYLYVGDSIGMWKVIEVDFDKRQVVLQGGEEDEITTLRAPGPEHN